MSSLEHDAFKANWLEYHIYNYKKQKENDVEIRCKNGSLWFNKDIIDDCNINFNCNINYYNKLDYNITTLTCILAYLSEGETRININVYKLSKEWNILPLINIIENDKHFNEIKKYL